MKKIGWKMSQEQQEKFKAAYRILYENEEDFIKAMDEFDPDFQVIPDLSFPTYRRALIGRIITGKRRDTDPYRTGDKAFHFDDVKYFLGDDPIDLFFYGNHEPQVIRVFLRDFHGYGSTKPLKLAKTALDNAGVKIRDVVFGAWDSDHHKEPVLYYFSLTNPEVERCELTGDVDKNYSQMPMVSGNSTEPPNMVRKDYKNPLLVVENHIVYGRKHEDLESFLLSRNLGLDRETLVFNFVGRHDFNPYNVPCHFVKNVLRLI